MGRIKKAAGAKHEATVSPAVTEFVNVGCSLPLSQLPKHLDSFLKGWPFPRGDLYHWIPLLNRFDAILELVTTEYGLSAGPQTKPFSQSVLLRGVAEENKSASLVASDQEELDKLGYSSDGDRQLTEAILQYTQTLLDNCGNRSLYSSSERLDKLLNNVNLTLVSATLQVAACLAQRYHTSRQRITGHHQLQHLSHAMLASHYNIDLEKVQKLANPFAKAPSPVSGAAGSVNGHVSVETGKTNVTNGNTGDVDPKDLLALAEGTAEVNGRDSSSMGTARLDPRFQDWANVQITYYKPADPAKEEQKSSTTPNPVRRSSGGVRQSRSSQSDESADSESTNAVPTVEQTDPGAMKILEIPASKILSSPIEETISDGLSKLPAGSYYELLNKVRIASAVTASSSERQQVVSVRLLALTNLAYIYPESILQHKILQQDSDEPRHFQIVHQLTSILHPPDNGASRIPPKLQTLALNALAALAKHKSKEPDICSALGINANHGVLFYVFRKVVAEMSSPEAPEVDLEAMDRREAALSLLESLPRPHNRVAENLVGAGIFDILVEALNLRTAKAERHRSKLVATLIMLLQGPRESLQVFANARGLDSLSHLVQYEVQSALENAEEGRGLPKEYRNPTIDYQIPYAQRETLRLLCKCISNMMQNNSGNFDRLLRNLIDSSPLLSGLRTVIRNPKVYGASIWSGSVNIMSSFIHNEPTSYSILSEAGLSSSLFESIAGGSEDTPSTEPLVQTSDDDHTMDHSLSATNQNSEFESVELRDLISKAIEREDNPVAEGFLPHVDAILAIPQAFGAICLNNSGKELLISSHALYKFFEVFESVDHVKAMNGPSDYDTPRLLGSAFDELVRHHPDLKTHVQASVTIMMARLQKVCQMRGKRSNCGAKLLVQTRTDQVAGSAERAPILDDTSNSKDNEDTPMIDAVDMGNEIQTETVPPNDDLKSDEDKEGAIIANLIEIAMRFLGGLFENASLLSFFAENHGATKILSLATMPYLPYDFNNHHASQETAKVVHMLAEQKPHLVLPEVLTRTLKATDKLQQLYECNVDDGFFRDFTAPGQLQPAANAHTGTKIACALANVQTLCNILYETFSAPIMNPRSTHTPFSQVNLTDIYQKVVKRLGLLHRVCVWEEILLQKRLPDSWKEATRIRGYGMGSEEADEVFGFISNEDENPEDADAPTVQNAEHGPTEPKNENKKPERKGSLSKDEKSPQFRNARTLRYLLSQIPSCIVPFFQALGKSLVAKRRPETYLRQNAYLVAEALSRANIDQLNYEIPRRTASSKDRYAYWIVTLTSISQLIVEGASERPHAHVLTLLLQAFKNDGGLEIIQEILNVFYVEVHAFHSDSEEAVKTEDGAANLTSAYGGIKIILSFYAQVTAPKAIIESNQSHAIASTDRDRASAHFFSAQQFLVEIRQAIFPNIKLLWGSDFVDKASTSIIKCLIEILTTILEGADEQDAFKRRDDLPAKRKPYHKVFSVAADKLRFLTEKGYDQDLAREALYRCMNTQNAALEYCVHMKGKEDSTRLPIPEYDQEKSKTNATQPPTRTGSGPSGSVAPGSQETPSDAPQDVRDQDTSEAAQGLFLLAQGAHDSAVNNTLVEVEEGDDDPLFQGLMAPPPAPGVPQETEPSSNASMHMSLDFLDVATPTLGTQQNSSQSRSSDRSPSASHQAHLPKEPNQVTVDDLDDNRSIIKENLVERVLDVLNVHDDVTFELATLIGAAAMKDADDKANRQEIGETLIEALISFTIEDDFRPSGKKIASYAHLLGICLQDDKFFEASLDCLKENMTSLFGFIKIFPDQAPDQSPTWIPAVLLVIERILSEDAQPAQIKWTAPSMDEPMSLDEGVLTAVVPLIPVEEKVQLSEALLEIMPRIGKDQALVLSVVRALVVLSRNRQVASKLSEKRNIQRLFLMIKQLSGMTNQKLPGTFMIFIRHLVEDDETIRQIMKSEIAANFEPRPGRQTDVTAYIRQHCHLVLRSPEIFIDVTNDMVEIPKYNEGQRAPVLRLKPLPHKEGNEDAQKEANGKPEDAGKAADEQSALSEIKTSETLIEQVDNIKGKSTESKAPVVESPSGVVHYLLTELLAYKDVEDKEGPSASKPSAAQEVSQDSIEPPVANGTAASSTNGSVESRSALDSKRHDKPEYRPENHPIYIYRCFILQCLTELLQSYNKAKIEFINFSRKADPKSMTPSKPRSGVLNYLLNDVIPVGTLDHEDSVAYKKRTTTSNSAISTIVALCLKTDETGHDSKPGAVDEDDQADLLFVRKFVLEHALKAYKDAASSDEHPDVKYARLLDLADLFQRLLIGRLGSNPGPQSNPSDHGFQKSIAKLMYEKNFIAALTSSIADVDLNFPGSKRAIKYILRPLKQLTQIAVLLSETSSISSGPGQTDEEEISSASSVSEVAGEREETPDLFRNSTLGMLEPGRDDESASGSSEDEDDEMFDDDEDEVMDFDEDVDRDGDEVISDEDDEELNHAGPIEGLHGDAGMDVEVVIDEEDDDDEDEDDEEEDEPTDDDDDDDDLDDSDNMDDNDDVEVMDEITGDDENASLVEGDDWQGDVDEDVEGEFGIESHENDGRAEIAVQEIMHDFGGEDEALNPLERLDGAPSNLQMDIDEGRYMDDVIRNDDDEDEQDEEDNDREDEADEEEELYQPEFDDEDHGMPDPPWGFDPDEDSFVTEHHHHHHHHHHHRHMPRRIVDPWNMPPHASAGVRGSNALYRSHRPTMRSNDDAAHPLLQRSDRSATSGLTGPGRSAISDAAASISDYWVHGMDLGGGTRGLMAESPVSFVNSIIAAIGSGVSTLGPIGGHQNRAIHVQIGGPGRAATISTQRGILPDLSALLGPRGLPHGDFSRADRDEQPSLAAISPELTPRRWEEEARLIWSTSINEKAMRVFDSILRVLVPPAIEERKRQEETTKRLREQQQKLREEEEAQAKEKEEAEREVREKEEREAADRAREEAAAQADAGSPQPRQGADHDAPTETANGSEDVVMAGAETVQNQGSSSSNQAETSGSAEATAESSQTTQRIVTRLGDRDIDITSLGIDLAYLEALPDDIRQEVLMSQIAIQRSQAAAAGEPPSEISQEFLEALPPDIREELLQQEAQDRRRREREEARRQQQQATGGSSRAEDMDPASFLASLDPTLRQHVLAEQDEEMLSHLPPEIAAEARALGGDRSMHRFAGMPGRRPTAISRLLDPRGEGRRMSPIKKAPRKQVVQMLDKAGVATLLRLIFSPQQGSSRDSFNAILRHISQNRQTRAEVVSLLLSILQDGSFDVNAVERSFTQLSLRAKQPSVPKTPQALKRTLTGSGATASNSVEVTPLTVIQQCLGTLVSLTQTNPHIPSFFLTEHELSFGTRTKSSRKGKAKDSKASRYPLNALLTLLDRKLIMESSACLEQLASLLQSVTNPLNILTRAQNPEPDTNAEDVENSAADTNLPDVPGGNEESDPDGATNAQTEEPTAAATSGTDGNDNAQSLVEPNDEQSTSGVVADGTKQEVKTDQKAKKARSLVPPVVPEENLRLVVGIVAARECSKRTFQQTVATISNLKAIPGAKEVFGKGLIEQAQDLSQSILEDLDDLLPQIKQAESGTDIQGLALTKFATASSHQSKLLRVLTALDYLFGWKPEDAKKINTGEQDEGSGKPSTAKDDAMLTSLYENSTFGPLWDKLSECLSAIGQGEGMLNIASILQPLIEALMVVCKNTTLKESPLVKNAKEFAVMSPAPESRVESLFFRFTEEHRKILNELVRHNPKLMMGTFSLLVKNPKVLEFDNKRSYFTRRLHSRGSETRHAQPPLQLSVRRDQVFLDSFKFLSFKSGDEIKYGKLSIRFNGEEGVDAGGVTREWFQVLSRQMFNPDYVLFIPVASDRTTFHPNKLSKINEEHLMFFKFIGRIIGKALYEGRALDCHFSRAVYKRILGKAVSIKDMETLDLDYYKSLLWMLENDITEIITETFSIETDDFGVPEVVDLTENGRNIPVTEENKHDYVQRVVEYRLTGSVQTQLEKFLEGFHDIVPPELISIFNEQELELLISGLPDIDVDDWKNHTEYHNYQSSSPQIQWFWRAVRSFDKEERAKLLQFVTGTSKVPLNGFGQLEGMNGFSRFNIHRDYGNKERLPSSHTCFNQLDLPEYDSYESLRKHLYTAMTAGSEYFGFA